MASLGPPKAPSGPPSPGRSSSVIAPSSVASSVTSASRFGSSTRPPRVVVVVAAANTALTVYLIFLVGIEEAGTLHYLGAALGMFVSVALLGWFRQRIAFSKSDGRFLDWRVSSSRVMTSVTTFGWIAGIANLFVICYELSRKFTS